MVMENHKIILRPWGKEVIYLREKNIWVKKINIKNGHRASLQSHKGRDETWIGLSGATKAIVGNKTKILKAGDIIKVKKGQKHRWAGVKNACVLEVAFGKLNENDIFRYQDDYGRADKK